LISGSNELYNDRIRLSKPLKTDKTITSAAVPKATPSMDIIEITCIKFLFFLDRKYLFAMNKEVFKLF